MIGLFKQRVLWRFLALGILTLCLSILSRSTVNTPLLNTNAMIPSPLQTESPRVTAPAQPDSPLVILSPRIISWDGQYLEVALDLINVSSKSIRAYAIKQGLEGEEGRRGVATFTSFELTNLPALLPNQSTTTFDVYQTGAAKPENVMFFVDYVEFSDGTKWGLDSANFAERSAGQRACAYILSKRLLKILNVSDAADVMKAIEAGTANIEPPANRSDEWREGFRGGCKSVASQLRRAQNSGRLSQVESELRKFAKRFPRAN
jgi:hypothetical protein